MNQLIDNQKRKLFFPVCVLLFGVSFAGRASGKLSALLPSTVLGIEQIAAGFAHTRALADKGLKCWGFNGSFQTEVPTSLVGVRQFSLGDSHTCALGNALVK